MALLVVPPTLVADSLLPRTLFSLLILTSGVLPLHTAGAAASASSILFFRLPVQLW